MSAPVVRLDSLGGGAHGRSYTFEDFRYEIEACHIDEVMSALASVEAAARGGLFAAGFVSYEAASAFDPSLSVRTQIPDVPLAWFGVYGLRTEAANVDRCEMRVGRLEWAPSVTHEEYSSDIARIRNYIEAGDAYQVNHTFRLETPFNENAWAYYQTLCESQSANYAAYVETDRFQVLSASPELFFALSQGTLTMRPMKGTNPRGRWPEEDDHFARRLTESEKNRAENLMIVDLLRNDLGRVSKTGSVEVTDLWCVEAYETLFQMTSTVTSEISPETGLADLFGALFPCGSVTGAPKVRTMQIISETEHTPRGIYTGAIGHVSPGGDATFNVAIRTVWVDRITQKAIFGVGGGITWDSTSEDEYQECLTKARILTERRPAFYLFETLRLDPGEGFYLLERHFSRLANSARYFGFLFDRSVAEERLSVVECECEEPSRIRLILEADGSVACESSALKSRVSYRASLSPVPIDSSDVFLFHKTSNRSVYDRCRAAVPGVDDVILVNERGELTEMTIGNLVLRIDGRDLTPPVRSGLLGGTFREALLASDELEEAVLSVADLQRADSVYMINSVREWVPVEIVDQETSERTLTMGS